MFPKYFLRLLIPKENNCFSIDSVVNHRLAKQENTLILCLQFTSEIRPSMNSRWLAPALIFLKLSFTELTTLSSLRYSGISKKEHWEKKCDKEQGNQNILAASPEGLAESGCMLLTPGNTWTGTGTGRLPSYRLVITAVRNVVPSESNIT